MTINNDTLQIGIGNEKMSIERVLLETKNEDEVEAAKDKVFGELENEIEVYWTV